MTNNTITAIVKVTNNNKEWMDKCDDVIALAGEGNWEPQFPLQYNPRMHCWE